MTNDSSSDDDFYDNFQKIKAKASQQMRKIEESRNPNYQKKSTRKNDEQEHFFEEDICINLDKSPSRSIDEKPTTPQVRSSSSSPILIIEDNNFSVIPNPTPIIDLSDENSFCLASSASASKPNHFAHTCNFHIHSNGNTRIFVHDMDDKIRLLINEYAERTGSNPERVILITKQLKRCDPDDSPRSLGFAENATIELDAFENADKIDIKTIKIKYQMKGKKATIQKILPDLNFQQLRLLFCNEHKLNPQKVYFVFDSDRINDDDTPSSIGLEDMDCIDVYLKE